ncbi:hypothetical protein Nepgr_019426 [Nepenthes gracilis]|uniref:Uncharacterized protein n=1 Tax=Nepenthes gracilis TaxID=150966 RepID=A0AAD3STI9_NEPGR|nr:hypothetical protein Nepgr_019426 [Nepenthes gracilis]
MPTAEIQSLDLLPLRKSLDPAIAASFLRTAFSVFCAEAHIEDLVLVGLVAKQSVSWSPSKGEALGPDSSPIQTSLGEKSGGEFLVVFDVVDSEGVNKAASSRIDRLRGP